MRVGLRATGLGGLGVFNSFGLFPGCFPGFKYLFRTAGFSISRLEFRVQGIDRAVGGGGGGVPT